MAKIILDIAGYPLVLPSITLKILDIVDIEDFFNDDIRSVLIYMVLSGIGWAIKWGMTKRKRVSELENIDSETESNEATTYASLVESIEKLNNLQMIQKSENDELRKRLGEQGEELAVIKKDNKKIREQNKQLLEINEKRKEEISELQHENKLFREMLTDAQLNTQIMRMGVRKLISQLEDMNIIPAFTLPKQNPENKIS